MSWIVQNDISSKRRKLNSIDYAAQPTIEYQDEMTLQPVLPDHVISPVPLVSVYAARVLDQKKTSQLLRQLSELYPLEGLSHIKRVRRNTYKDGDIERAELQIILCETRKIKQPINREICAADILQDASKISRDLLGEPFMAEVAKVPPQTRAQFDETSRHWPTAFHEDKELSRIISGEIFAGADRARIQAHMKTLSGITGQRKAGEKETVAAMIVDPKANTRIALTSCREDEGDYPLQHAVMKCIDLVAHSQGGGAWTVDPDFSFYHLMTDKDGSSKVTPYLCTGYELYVSHEPCIMCAMALVHSRIYRVFYAESHPDGALGSKYKLHTLPDLNHRYQVFKVQLNIDTSEHSLHQR